MRKRQGAPTALGTALRDWVERAGLARRIDLAQAVADWPALVGPQIAAVTRADSVTPDGVLRVRVVSSAWATELSLLTPRILARLNEGRRGRIRDIRWFAGPLDRP